MLCKFLVTAKAEGSAGLQGCNKDVGDEIPWMAMEANHGVYQRVEWDTHRQPRWSKKILLYGGEIGEANWNKEATRCKRTS